MTDDAVRILERVQGPADLRPDFEEELLGVLMGKLREPQPRPAVAVTPTSVQETPRLFDRVGVILRRRWALASVMSAVAAATALIISVVAFDVTRPGESTEGNRVASPAEGPDLAPRDTAQGDGVDARGHAQASDSSVSAGPVRDDEGGRGVVPQPPPQGPGPGQPVDDSDVLAFASQSSDGYWHIHTMNADGSERRQLTEAEAHDREPDWSPDGTKIAFVRLTDPGRHLGEVWVVNADGSGERFLAYGGEPQWSPDGRQIAYTGYLSGTSTGSFEAGSVWVMDADGSNQKRVYQGEGAAGDATWSPLGILAFAGVMTDMPPDGSGMSQTTNLYSMTEDGSSLRRLTDTFYACNSEFSPDGRRLAFIRSDGGPFLVWSMRMDGSDKTQLTEGPGTYAFPHWSPDGKRIAFGFDPDGEPHWTIAPAGPGDASIWIMRSDGTRLRRISPEGSQDADPAFAPDDRRVSERRGAVSTQSAAGTQENSGQQAGKSIC